MAYCPDSCHRWSCCDHKFLQDGTVTVMAEYIVDARPSDLFGIKMTGIVVRCKDCKHKPIIPEGEGTVGYLEFPKGSQCPCQGDMDYSWYPGDDWFCANGEREEVNQ